jgi:hypothetical protein
MLFKDTLEDIRKKSYDQICTIAKNTFEQELKEVLVDSAKFILDEGKIKMFIITQQQWFKDLKILLDFEYENYKVFEWLINETIKNPIFDGVNMWLSSDPKTTSINFKWNFSENELSITHLLKNILEENKNLIINQMLIYFDV